MRVFGRAALAAAACLAALALASGCGSRESLRVEAAWVRAAAPGEMTGGYLTVINEGPRACRLVSVRGAAADTIEMHRTVREDGRARMEPVPAFEVPAGSRLELQPGGSHLMFLGVRPGLAAGGRTPLLLHFGDGRQVTVNAEVRR